MRNRTHEAIGAAVTLGVCAAADSGALVAAGAVCASLLGSRLPDADVRGARIHRRTRLERRSVVARLAGRVLRLPMTIFAASARHRGATHWLLTAAAATIVLTAAAGAVWPALMAPVAIGAGCGYGAHLLADACTPHGVPLLGPFSSRRIHLLPAGLRVATGGIGDRLMLITAALAAAALGFVVLQAA
ncbi:MAG: LexA-binding, inner rane-associated putative hydrolase [Solirubrobacteraceae bacterium]|nr:LexA-binding, inner rane-associated putative hydrolase [Solirubrobacteraceae bacterium]